MQQRHLDTMMCLEYFRLHQHYVVAVRRCEQAELSSSRSGLLDASARLTAEIKQKARNERNAAKERMVLHEQNCSACNPARKFAKVS
jgi:hypothetical protein